MSPRVGLDIETIIMTAIEIADNHGVEAVTLASVARNLSVKPPSLFNHINGLSDLKRELSLYGLTLLFEKINDRVRGKQKNEAIFAMSTAYIEFTREHPGLYELTIKAPENNDKELEGAGNKIIQLLMGILSDYHLDQETIIHAIRGWRSILHGFASLEQKGAFGMPVDTEKSINYIIEGFISTISK
nr:TetR-like C-terminal domain-containing protein [Lysinibacillus timonensis]